MKTLYSTPVQKNFKITIGKNCLPDVRSVTEQNLMTRQNSPDWMVIQNRNSIMIHVIRPDSRSTIQMSPQKNKLSGDTLRLSMIVIYADTLYTSM